LPLLVMMTVNGRGGKREDDQQDVQGMDGAALQFLLKRADVEEEADQHHQAPLDPLLGGQTKQQQPLLLPQHRRRSLEKKKETQVDENTKRKHHEC